MATYPICEFVEPDESEFLFRVRLRGGDLPANTRNTLVLRSRSGKVVAVSEATVTWRVNTTGEWTRSAFNFRIKHSELPAGGFRLELRSEEAEAGRYVAPSAGVLAESRPRLLGRTRVFQIFPGSGKQVTWIRLASTSRSARFAWKLRNLARDVAFFAQLRRFSWLRLARFVTKPFVPRGKIWLIGERPETARDNGAAFFEYLRQERPADPIFYVITRESPMRGRVEAQGNVIDHSSFRHRVFMLHAKVLANAYSIKHMLPSNWHPGAYMKQATWRLGARRVYLKHGIHLSPYAVKRANGGYDLFLTAGDPEHQALEETSGYSRQLAKTGLARFDNLLTNRPAASGRILFMPTWRRYLAPPLFGGRTGSTIPFEGSAYEAFMESFLRSQKLDAILEQHDLKLLMIPHYNLASNFHAGFSPSPRIEVGDAKTANIPQLLKECDALITDYSSVHFDVAYVGSPIIYAQFDQEDYKNLHGASSWFDFQRDGFGPVVSTAAETVGALEHYAKRNFEREALYTDRLGRVFEYHDRANRARIAQAVDSLVP